MIKTSTCYAAICDQCGHEYSSNNDYDETHYPSPGDAKGAALDSDWHMFRSGALWCDRCCEREPHEHEWKSYTHFNYGKTAHSSITACAACGIPQPDEAGDPVSSTLEE